MPEPRRRLAEAWGQFRDSSIPEEATAAQRRIIRHAFMCGAAAYLRGLAQAAREGASMFEGDVEAIANYSIEQGNLMAGEMLQFADDVKNNRKKRMNGTAGL